MRIPKFEKDMMIENNPYNYKINILHEKILPIYNSYKKSIGEGCYPISDAERFKFEEYFLKKWEQTAKKKIAKKADDKNEKTA